MKLSWEDCAPVFRASGRGLPTLLVGLMLAMVLFSCSREEPMPEKEVIRPVKVMTVASGDTSAMRSFPGTVSAIQEVDLSFKVSGPLVELVERVGTSVKRGQVVARIDPRDFKINLDKARAQAVQAEQQYQRYKDLYIQKQVSEADFDNFKSARDVAVAQREDAQNALNDTYLKAPFSGVIAKKYVDNFQDVRPMERIVSLQDVSRVKIHIDAPESLVGRIRDEKAGEVYAQFAVAPGKKFPLELSEYSAEADPKTQTYKVTFTMDAPTEINVLPGMTANVTGSPETGEQVAATISIPATAVAADEQGNSFVWVVDPQSSKVTARKVSTGALTGTDRIIIDEGLQSGDSVVVAGVNALREGMQVRPMDN